MVWRTMWCVRRTRDKRAWRCWTAFRKCTKSLFIFSSNMLIFYLFLSKARLKPEANCARGAECMLERCTWQLRHSEEWDSIPRNRSVCRASKQYVSHSYSWAMALRSACFGPVIPTSPVIAAKSRLEWSKTHSIVHSSCLHSARQLCFYRLPFFKMFFGNFSLKLKEVNRSNFSSEQ